jgi:hypothetical protein
MRIRSVAAVLTLLVFGAPALAQDFAVMESAETINRGNFKLIGYPMLVFGEEGADNQLGGVVRVGYGFTDNLDIEAKASFFDGLTIFGADVEFWLIKGGNLDVSVSGGFHFANGDEIEAVDSTGIDLTGLISTPVTDSLELYVALDVAFESFDFGDSPGIDDSFTSVHIVPGLEYKVMEDLDFVAEFGLGLTDEEFFTSANYVAVGLAYYVR